MDAEDLEPRKEAPKVKNLEVMGVDELEEYLAELDAEMARVRDVIAAKKSHLGDAETLFQR